LLVTHFREDSNRKIKVILRIYLNITRETI
jgi:hypothetical protein